ncbi:MAG: STAS domain-containing protein [Chloroflexota bacterium]|nr:STAS domain-containing protein [Chloroflexota bacterium]
MIGPVSVIKLGTHLIVTIHDEMSDSQILEMQEQIATTIEESGAEGLLLDVSLLDVVDSFMGHTLNQLAAIARLMGTRTVVVGLRPGVAITLIELGLELPYIHTALDVEQGLELLRESNGRARA